MTSPKTLLNQLRNAIAECAQVFDVKSLAALQKQGADRHPMQEIKTRAYLVLVHAAFEDFFEQLADLVADKALENWAGSKKSVPACAILYFSGPDREDFDKMEPRFTDRGRKAVAAGIAQHKQRFIERNNGISMRHLRALYFPLGVDLPDDFKSSSAIDELRVIRGDAAHRMRTGLSDLKPMRDWLDVVDDCVVFCELLVKSVDTIQW